MILQKTQLRNLLLFVYLLGAIPFSIYQFSTRRIHTTVSKSGHLIWNYFNAYVITWIFWLFFLLFSFFYQKNAGAAIIALITLLIAFFNYRKDNSVGSMWCWGINSIMIYYAAYLLIYLPFLEKNSVC